MEELEMETRPIGMEDIGWDTEGKGDSGYYEDGYGEQKSYSKINANHIPLPEAVRSRCDGAKNVASALKALVDMILSREGEGGALSEDTTVVLYTALSLQEKQALIDDSPRNLGGHTLEFVFQESGDESFSTALDFSGFYNGKLVIDLNSITISDISGSDSLLNVNDCFCEVEIRNGSIVHTHCLYGVVAENCPSVRLKNIAFTGDGTAYSYAFYGVSSDGYAESCTYTADKAVKISGQIADFIKSEEVNYDFISMASAREETGSTGNLIFDVIS